LASVSVLRHEESLSRATGLIFAGVFGRRLPAGISKEEAFAAARSEVQNQFADLLRGLT
jgi:hypothetical protein